MSLHFGIQVVSRSLSKFVLVIRKYDYDFLISEGVRIMHACYNLLQIPQYCPVTI